MRVPKRIAGRIERHLGETADDDLFAKAMTSICDGFPPACSQAFTCLHGGDCFAGRQDISAARAIEKAALSEEGGVKSLMLAAAHALRKGDVKAGAEILTFPGHAPEEGRCL